MSNINSILKGFIVDGLGNILPKEGFVLKGKNTFIRKVGECKQEINVLFRKINRQEAGYIQIFAAFTFDQLEKLTAELKGEGPRKDWPTVSINIGNLKKERDFAEWFLNEETDINSLSKQISNYLKKYAYPFWNQFSSIQQVKDGFENKDLRLMLNGNSYKWKMAACYWFFGETEKAKQVLKNWEKGKPSVEVLNQALKRLTE